MIVTSSGTEHFVFDGHVHLGRARPYQTSNVGVDAYHAEDLIRDMDQAGVDMAVAFPRAEPITDYTSGNGYVLEAARRYPTRIVPYARINPYFADRCLDQIDQYAARGVRGIKLHPFKDFGATAVNSVDFIHPILERAGRHGLVVIIHSGGPWNATPTLIGDLALSFPSVNFILAHAGGELEEDTMVVAKLLPTSNYYVDCAGVHNPKTIGRLVRALGADHVLFGSDRASVPYGFEISKIARYAALDDQTVAGILGGNLLKLLGIEPDVAAYQRVDLAAI
ncbi:hypothetical protein GCM10023322_76410 [Rugosimonospora acidiphila]|uniref:Amidohydrolase-related domain-containing protein n=1 Tax=Rugosimonospora acidiphila TaxID=556531 RepID=A0ABP9SNR4_9ACTN